MEEILATGMQLFLAGLARNAGGVLRLSTDEVFTNTEEDEALELVVEDDGNTIAFYLVKVLEEA